MAGDPDQADVLFEDAVAEGRAEAGQNIGACVALAERSLLAIGKSAWDLGRRYLSEARSVAREANLADYPPVTILHAAAARIALHEADPARAREELTRAQRLRPGLTYALPHLAVQARIELARCHLALSDLSAARTLLGRPTGSSSGDPASATSSARPTTSGGTFPAPGSSALGASALTDAELRLLPMLATHLTFPEIAAEMFLSRNTIKTEANSIYRKLGATSRSQAVARSRELRLLEG